MSVREPPKRFKRGHEASLKKIQKGEIRNPYGPRGKHYPGFVQDCRALTPECMNVLKRLLRDEKSPRTQYAAATFILDHGWGRAPMEIKVAPDENVKFLSDAELNAKIREVMDGAKVVNGKLGSDSRSLLAGRKDVAVNSGQPASGSGDTQAAECAGLPGAVGQGSDDSGGED